MELEVDRAGFARDGYLHFPGVFSFEEVKGFRDFLVSNVPRTNDATALDVDLLTRPETEAFINDGRVLGVARQILGDTPIYFGDSSAMRYPKTAAVSTFHKDNADRHDHAAPDWSDDYPLIRFGIYLQDHTRQGGGLMVRAGSHRSVAKSRLMEVFREEVSGWLNGKTRYLFAAAGDLIVWNMRLTHAGMGRFLKGPLKRPLTERNQRFVPEFMQATVGEDRLAMFASFGKEHPLFDRYLQSLKLRKYMVEMWRTSAPGEDAVARLEANGGRYLDMSRTVEAALAAGEAIGVNDRWTPLPY
jgi:hypothetical protein